MRVLSWRRRISRADAFERRVRDVRVGPLDEDAFALDLAWRRDRGRRLIAADVQARNVRRIRQRRPGERRLLDVNGVELAVSSIVRIELHADEAVRVADLVGELVEDAVVLLTAVEIEIGRELLRRLVEDVERPVEIVDEEARRAARFLAQRVDAREHPVGLPLAVEQPGDRHCHVVFELQRDRRRIGCCAERRQDDEQTSNASGGDPDHLCAVPRGWVAQS